MRRISRLRARPKGFAVALWKPSAPYVMKMLKVRKLEVSFFLRPYEKACFCQQSDGSFANRFIVTRSGKKNKSFGIRKKAEFGIRKKAECAGKNDRGVPHCGIACPKMQGRCIGGRGALRSFVFGNFVGERLELLKGKCGNGSFLFSLHSTLFVRPRPHERVPPLTH